MYFDCKCCWNYCGARGTQLLFLLLVTFCKVCRIVVTGTSARLTIRATGQLRGPVGVQWYKQSTLIYMKLPAVFGSCSFKRDCEFVDRPSPIGQAAREGSKVLMTLMRETLMNHIHNHSSQNANMEMLG